MLKHIFFSKVPTYLSEKRMEFEKFGCLNGCFLLNKAQMAEPKWMKVQTRIAYKSIILFQDVVSVGPTKTWYGLP